MKKALLLVTLFLSGCNSTFISYSYEVNSNKYNTEPAIEIYEVQSGEFTLFDLNYYVEIIKIIDTKEPLMVLIIKGDDRHQGGIFYGKCFSN